MAVNNGVDDLHILQNDIFSTLELDYSLPIKEPESQEYNAFGFQLNQKQVQYRCAKITPTKIGQFVTLWKRDAPHQKIRPYNDHDDLDMAIIATRKSEKLGFFIFPISLLIQQGIVKKHKAGKRGFRVYPTWDSPTSKQALKTQQWQLKYFFEIAQGKLTRTDYLIKLINN